MAHNDSLSSMSVIEVCRLSDIEDYQARGFTVTFNDAPLDLIVVRQGSQCMVYKNSCPHTGVNLEWQPDEFLSEDGNYLQCALHGAMFQVEDGLCVVGPCVNDRLYSYRVQLVDDGVYIETT